MTPKVNKFQELEFSEAELAMALGGNPYVIAYVQNKMAVYANQLVSMDMEFNEDPMKQMKLLMEINRLKSVVAAYEELLNEFMHIAVLSDDQSSQPSDS